MTTLHLNIKCIMDCNAAKLIKIWGVQRRFRCLAGERQSLQAVTEGDSWNMSELDSPLSEPRKVEEGRESFCSCIELDTSPMRAPTS